MATDTRLIEAAGGVLWRPAANGVGTEICLVHRPKYDDCSVPKGKLGRGEHPLVAAAREVQEETGFDTIVGQPLGELRYLKEGVPKRVRYWAMQVAGGEFVANDEVDRLMWVTPEAALALMTPDRDPPVVVRFAEEVTAATVPLIIVRHGSAGDPSAWVGDDHDRPLDETGRRQASAFVELLLAYGITAVLSADVLRCRETVAPFAEKASITITSEPLFADLGHAQSPSMTAERLLTIAAAREPLAICSQGPVIGDLVTTLCAAYGFPAPKDPSLRKGTGWVAHLAVDEQRMVALEPLTTLL